MRWSVRWRVLLAFLAILTAFSALTIYSILLHRRTVAELGIINRTYLPLTLGTAELRATQLVFGTLLDRLVDDPDHGLTRDWIDAARRYRPQMLRELGNSINRALRRQPPRDEQEFLSDVRDRLTNVRRGYGRNERRFVEFYTASEGGQLDDAVARMEELKRSERRLDRELASIETAVRERITRLAIGAEQDGQRATWGLAILTALVLLSAVSVVISTNRLLSPLRQLEQAVQRVASGDLATQIAVVNRDEIGAVADAFNRMTAALAERDKLLREAERLATAGRLAAQVTHEIRNPLSSLMLNTELLGDELRALEPGSEARGLLQAMQDEIKRLTAITESYLRFARLPDPDREYTDLDAVVVDTLDFYRGELAAAGIEVTLELGRVAPFWFDPAQARQALLNLLRNAKEAIPAGGRIRVVTSARDGMARIDISDSGTGLNAEARQHLFESFFSTKSGGTGLGLALTRQIARVHGGDVTLGATGADGTTFSLSFSMSDGEDHNRERST